MAGHPLICTYTHGFSKFASRPISCVEFLLSETNVLFQQQLLAREAVRAVSCRLRDNVLDSVFASTLDAEIALRDDRFQSENRPEAEPKDRHAVRSVPSKSPEKSILTTIALHVPAKTSSPASRVGSNHDKVRPTRRRRKGEPEKLAIEVAPPAQTIEREGDPDEENPEVKEWRDKCLKTLEASTRKPGFARYVTVARAFSVPDSRVSMESGVITAPPLLHWQQPGRLHIVEVKDDNDEMEFTSSEVFPFVS
ncbi:uncharacterized protein KRP23_9131 [Phytophthora ramorum]|uniref:uncharacterized protein n=1 Tax=Phytophthora ramorum TaxID=164328 RepID=UPI0030A216F9|nr:hypothetical protein KRP23_9131 [Phytophthora ramorum]